MAGFMPLCRFTAPKRSNGAGLDAAVGLTRLGCARKLCRLLACHGIPPEVAMRFSLPLTACLLAALALPAAAQTRFPAIPEAQIEERLRNAYCGRNLSTIALTVQRTENWRGFAMRLCGPDYQPAGAFVAWFEQSGERRVVVTDASGRVLPSHPEQVNDANQQALFTFFATRIGNQRVGCSFARSHIMAEPWSGTFCVPIDAQGNVLNRN